MPDFAPQCDESSESRIQFSWVTKWMALGSSEEDFEMSADGRIK